MWLNENAGIVVLIFGILTIALLAVMLWLVFTLRNRFAVQRLKFVGLYATDVETRTDYAALTVGNRSVSEIAIKELGIKNGGVAFNLTALYKRKEGLDEKARIVIEQRRSIGFCLEREELWALLTDGKKGKELKTLRLYAIDLTGNVYQGRIPAVKKLLAGILAVEKNAARNGAPASFAPKPAQTAPAVKSAAESAPVAPAAKPAQSAPVAPAAKPAQSAPVVPAPQPAETPAVPAEEPAMPVLPVSEPTEDPAAPPAREPEEPAPAEEPFLQADAELAPAQLPAEASEEDETEPAD